MASVSPSGSESSATHQIVLSLIERNQCISRSDIARLSGLSRNTTSQIARELLKMGLIRETGKISATGGRPGIGLEIRANAQVALGAALRSREWVLALVNLRGDVIECIEESVDTRNPTAAIRSLNDAIRSLRQRSGYPVLPAVGIGVPGIVEPHSGVVTQAHDLGWSFVSIKEEIERVTKMRALVLNRHWGAGLAEGRWGGAAGADDYIYIGIGTGIRSAAYSKGKLVDGSASLAGQLGHMTVASAGPLCTCGNQGCLVSFASEQALIRRVEAAVSSGEKSSLSARVPLSAEAISNAAKDGDSIALEALRSVAASLGIAVANLVNVFNPERVVLGGPVGNTGEPLLSMITAETKRRALSVTFANVRLVSGTLGAHAEAIGAATLVLDRKLDLLMDDGTARFS